MVASRAYVNCRFRSHRPTGVHRYAIEMVAQLGDAVKLIEPPYQALGVKGQYWEQWKLPGQLPKDSILWSPCNTAPLACKCQMVTIHDAAFVDTPAAYSWAFRNWYRWLMPRLAKRAVKLFTVSEFSRERLAEVCGVKPEKFAITPCAADERFRPATEQELRDVREALNLPPRYILSLGSLDRRKNLRSVIKAWGTLPQWHDDITLVLAGGQGKSRVFSEPDLNPIPPAVQPLGYVDDKWLPALYSGAEAFVFASSYEGFGIPTLEAMACGTPVICSSTTAFPSVAGDAVEYVDPASIESIAAGIDKLLHGSDLRATLTQRGLDRNRLFSWKKSAEVVRDAFREIGAV